MTLSIYSSILFKELVVQTSCYPARITISVLPTKGRGICERTCGIRWNDCTNYKPEQTFSDANEIDDIVRPAMDSVLETGVVYNMHA